MRRRTGGFRIDSRYLSVDANGDAPAFFAKATHRGGHRVTFGVRHTLNACPTASRRSCGRDVAGLATLTHTPSPMGFLSSILRRPKTEKPFLVIPVGFLAPDAVVPTITKKPLDDIRITI